MARLVDREILHPGETRAADALPLYLAACARADGLDPTRQDALAAAYDARGMDVGAATFSNLYPATAAAVFRPAAALSWDAFTVAWRFVMVGAMVALGVVFAALLRDEVRSPGRVALAAVVVAVLAWHPLGAAMVRLGQVNVVLAVICGVAIVGVVRAREGLSGGVIALGALVKLVPGALLVPALAARRWKMVFVAAVAGLVGVGLAGMGTSVPRQVEAIRDTLHFQASIAPDWMAEGRDVPAWVVAVGFVRHEALLRLSLAGALLAAWAWPSRQVLAGSMALLCVWLGADATGFHVLYLPLAFPGAFWLAGRAPLLGSVSLAGFCAYPFVGEHLPEDARAVVFGVALWVLVAVQLVREVSRAPRARGGLGRLLARPRTRHALTALAGVLVGATIVASQPGDGPRGDPLPPNTQGGAGFIRSGSRAPGKHAAAKGLRDVPGKDDRADTQARPGTIRALHVLLREAPAAWRAVAQAHPERAPLCAERAAKVPAAGLHDLSATEVGAWMREERAAVDWLATEGVDVNALDALLDAAWGSGLADARTPRP